jgi:hypothetical protein
MTLRSIALGSIVVLAGCATSGVPNVRTAAFPDGLYEFQERGEQATETFTGKVRILQDSMTVVESTPFCLQKPRAAKTEAFVFTCGDYGLTGYYRAGQWTMRYLGSRTQAVHTDNCVEYRKTPTGQTCVKRQSDRHDRVIPFSGVLHLSPSDTVLVAPHAP